jgi:hypothetical protein
MAFDTINMITSFAKAAMDPVGREDKNLTSENHNENLFSEDCAKTFSREDYDEIITRRSRHTNRHIIVISVATGRNTKVFGPL